MRNTILLVVCLSTILAVTILSCGGGGDRESVPELEGTWLGALENPGGPHVYQMTIDSSGDIREFKEDGVDLPRSATISRESDRLYSIQFESGAFGGLIVDQDADHALYLDNWFTVGVLQKGGTEFPDPDHFQTTDYVDSWSGYSIWVDSDMEVANAGTTTLVVDNEFDVIGTTLAGAFAGTIFGWSSGTSYFGISEGEKNTEDIFFKMFLSVDKQFMATYACPTGIIEFYDCEYGGWTR